MEETKLDYEKQLDQVYDKKLKDVENGIVRPPLTKAKEVEETSAFKKFIMACVCCQKKSKIDEHTSAFEKYDGLV